MIFLSKIKLFSYAKIKMKIPHLILVSFVVLFWGLNFVAIKIGLKTIPPIFLAFLRFFLVAFPAIFFIRRPSVPFTKVIIYGLVMFALQFSLFFAGMYDGVPPGLASILMQMHIFFSILFAAAFFREVPHVWQFVGGILAFSGIYVIASHIGGEMTLKGILLIISATMCWGLGNNISKTLGKVDMVSLVVWGSFFAWPPVLALSFYLEGVDTIVSAIKNLKPLAISCVL